MWITLIMVTLICGIISGMGIGGGAVFILAANLFSLFGQKEAQGYNLIMFIMVGIAASVSNLKNNVFDKKLFFKSIIPIILGSILGIYLAKITSEEKIRLYFYIFILIIGVYEIIASIINMINSKNKNKRKE